MKSARFLPARWSLSRQVIIVLALALLPLGILAVVAAADNYRDFRASQAALARVRIDYLRRAATASLDQEFAILQAMLLAGDTSPAIRRDCDRQFTRLARIDPIIDSLERLNAQGALLCASAGSALPSPTMVVPPDVTTAKTRFARAVLLDEGSRERDLVLGVRDLSLDGAGDTILARVRRAAAGRLIDGAILRGDEHVRLLRFGETVAAWNGRNRLNPLTEVDVDHLGPVERIQLRSGEQWFVGATSLGPSGFQLALARPANDISLSQALNIALPMVMWIVALVTGWAAINWLVVHPLGRMRRGVDHYAEDPTVRIAGDRARSYEIEQFGIAFDRMADRLDTHEDDLREALATQKKLTREVHHRVKNNLQIVSSLLSLQSRDAGSPEVACAYATIQKRVNALALVHRWLFDDEAMRGVDFKSLSHDLCAALEQSIAQSENVSLSIIPDVERIYVGQDTAVPLAFLITELVTAASRLDGSVMTIQISARAHGDRATMCIEAHSFRDVDPFAPGSADPSARIVQGMARQMRSALTHDPRKGTYAIDFPVAPPAGAASPKG